MEKAVDELTGLFFSLSMNEKATCTLNHRVAQLTEQSLHSGNPYCFEMKLGLSNF
jgi:hypothetical protein